MKLWGRSYSIGKEQNHERMKLLKLQITKSWEAKAIYQSIPKIKEGVKLLKI
jgi:hypothetical protein